VAHCHWFGTELYGWSRVPALQTVKENRGLKLSLVHRVFSTGSVPLRLAQYANASVKFMVSPAVQYRVALQPVLRLWPAGQARHVLAPALE
jgi:hypothetical protein